MSLSRRKATAGVLTAAIALGAAAWWMARPGDGPTEEVPAGSRRFRDVRFGPLSKGERDLAKPLLSHLTEGDLVDLDRGFYGVEFFRRILSRKAHFLVRVPSHVKLKAVAGTRKRDGDYLADIQPDPKLPALRLRIIEYHMRGFGKVRLATSLLDPAIPALDWILATCGTQEGDQDLRPSRNLRVLSDAIAQGVVDEIVQFAVVQTISGAPDDEHVGIVF